MDMVDFCLDECYNLGHITRLKPSFAQVILNQIGSPLVYMLTAQKALNGEKVLADDSFAAIWLHDEPYKLRKVGVDTYKVQSLHTRSKSVQLQILRQSGANLSR